MSLRRKLWFWWTGKRLDIFIIGSSLLFFFLFYFFCVCCVLLAVESIEVFSVHIDQCWPVFILVIYNAKKHFTTFSCVFCHTAWHTSSTASAKDTTLCIQSLLKKNNQICPWNGVCVWSLLTPGIRLIQLQQKLFALEMIFIRSLKELMLWGL